MRPLSRESDEQILRWLRLRTAGVSTGKIAKAFGVSRAAVVLATNKVRNADAAHCGDQVLERYW